MPQTLAEMLSDSRTRVLADIPPSEIAEKLPLEKLQEMQVLIARRLAAEKKRPVSPRATKSRPKAGSRGS